MKNIIKSISLCAVLFVAASCDDEGMDPVEGTPRVYASNNSDGNLTIYNVSNLNSIEKKTILTTSTAADGIYYSASSDKLTQVSRSENMITSYANISATANGAVLTVNISGSADMTSPREMAVKGNFYVVADNSDVDGDTGTKDGRFFIYEKNGSGFTLRNTITVDFKVWGIIFVDNTLYAIVDTDNKLASFDNFLNNTTDATVAATKTVSIETLVRTHGLTYSEADDLMILTDIGDAGNGTDDGGFHMISSFDSKFSGTSDGGTISQSDQVIVKGAATQMGNPVDVAYDSETNVVYIAEAGNNGGRVLAFSNASAGGNLSPSMNESLSAASSVFFKRN